MITITHSFSFNDEAIKGFAIFLWWQEKIQQFANEDCIWYIEVDNPESYIDYVKRLSMQHSEAFTTGYASHIVEEMVATEADRIRPALEEQIIEPVKQALQVEVTVE